MKKTIFTLAIILTVALSSVSCTTDSYDVDMEKNSTNAHSDGVAENSTSETDNETDPIVIPKRD